MTGRVKNVLFLAIVVLAPSHPARAQQSPCSEQGPGCRPMTSAEVKASRERFLALRAALPVPDPARYALASGVGEAYTMPFVAETHLAPGPLCACSWRAGCFVEKNDVTFPYDVRADRKKPREKPKDGKEGKDVDEALRDALAQVEAMQAEVGSRVEVIARLLPHPFLVDEVNGKCVEVSDPEAVHVERSATFLSWESGDGGRLTVVFGPRTCKEAETLRVERPAPRLAPVTSVELGIVGPKAEVAELKKRIDRRAFEVLLGPVVK